MSTASIPSGSVSSGGGAYRPGFFHSTTPGPVSRWKIQGAANGIVGHGENSYFTIGGQWSRIFAPQSFFGHPLQPYQIVIAQPASTPATSSTQAAIAGETTAMPLPAAALTLPITTAADAVAAANADLVANTGLSSEPGLSGGSFDPANVTDVVLPGQAAGDSDWVVNYDASGGTNDITGTLFIDATSGTIEQATWFNPGDPTTSITLAQSTVMVTDEVDNLYPPDNIPNPACFAAGTMIDTDTGPVPVEALRPADRVIARGAEKPIVWIGYRSASIAVAIPGRNLFTQFVSAPARSPRECLVAICGSRPTTPCSSMAR